MRRSAGLWIALASCEQGGTVTIVDATTLPDADADTDADADADADTDADTDAGGTFSADQVLVVPQARGLALLANDGSAALAASWSDLVGDCPDCAGQGASADGDGLLVSFTLTGDPGPGGIARLGPDALLDFRLDGFDFPHDVTRDPADGALVVTEALSDRLLWVAGDGGSVAPVRTLDDGHPDWSGLFPNGVEHLEHAGRSLLLTSHRGGADTGAPPAGEIALWDATDPGAPTRVWRFPPSGVLDTPHGCVLRERGGRWWLLWAHTRGAPDGGSVGLAVTDDPTVPPAYVADLVPGAAIGRFGFLKGVDLTDEDWLYLTDASSGGAGPSGRVVRAPMPDLSPTGATGALGDQVHVELDGATVFADALDLPFEGWLWVPTFPL
jgi:hypothetical protein